MDFFKALDIGFMILRALKNAATGEPATISFSFKGVEYDLVLMRASSGLLPVVMKAVRNVTP